VSLTVFELVFDDGVVLIHQSYRFALDPTPTQARALDRHAGAARFAFNWALMAVMTNLAQRDAERSYGVASEDLTPALGWNLPALRRAWNASKRAVAPWWRECSKESYNTGLDGVARALQNFSQSKAGARAGRPVGFPRFKARRRTTPAIRFTTGAIRAEPDRHHVTLPRLGRIKTHESTRKLSRRLEAGTARILSATVRRKVGRWLCAFTVEVQRAQHQSALPDAVVGVDIGIRALAVLSDGGVVPNPRHLDAALAALRSASRTLSRRQSPDRRTGQRPSKRWQAARAHVGRLHTRVANLRSDAVHKLTTRLAGGYRTVVVEDLYISGMMRNRRLARHIADVRLGEIRRHLSYKTVWNGGRLVVADRWFPSSKMCSACGVVKPKLPLRVRTFTCDACGLVIDRDLNAALNLKQYVARSGWETRNGRGADRQTGPGPAGGCEASTLRRHAG
jgi:putative transposase